MSVDASIDQNVLPGDVSGLARQQKSHCTCHFLEQTGSHHGNRAQDGFIDWEWLRSNPVVEEKQFVRHIRLSNPIVSKVDGHRNRGIILKPE